MIARVLKLAPHCAIVVATVFGTGSLRCAASRSTPGVPAPGSQATSPSAVPSAAGAPDAHQQAAIEVLAALKNHDFDAVERHFDGPMQRAVPREKLDRVWSSAIAATGEMTSWRLIARDTRESYDELRFELSHENGRWQAILTFPTEGSRVVGMLIVPFPEGKPGR